jgi:hypothetical protein
MYVAYGSMQLTHLGSWIIDEANSSCKSTDRLPHTVVYIWYIWYVWYIHIYIYMCVCVCVVHASYQAQVDCPPVSNGVIGYPAGWYILVPSCNMVESAIWSTISSSAHRPKNNRILIKKLLYVCRSIGYRRWRSLIITCVCADDEHIHMCRVNILLHIYSIHMRL